MAENEQQRLSLDASEYINALDEVTRANLKLGASNQLLLKSFSQTFDNMGDLASTTFKGITEAGRSITAVFNDTNKEMTDYSETITRIATKTQTASQAIKEHAKSLAALKSIQADVANQKQVEKSVILSPIAFKSIKDELTNTFGDIPADASIAATQRIGKAIGSLSEQMSRGEITFRELQVVINSVKNNEILPPNLLANEAVQNLTRSVAGLGQELVSINNKSKAAFDRVAVNAAKARQVAIDKATETTQKAAYPDASVAVQKALGPLPPLTNAETKNLITPLENMTQSLATLRVSEKQFLADLDDIRNKRVLPPSANEDLNEFRRYLLSVIITTDKATERLNKLKAAAAVATQAAAVPGIFGNVKTDITKSLGPIPKNLNTADIERVNSLFGAISQQIASAKVSYNDFVTQLGNIKGKKFVPPDANEDINKLRANIAGIGSAFESAENRGKSFFSVLGSLRLLAVQVAHSFIAKISSELGEANKAASEFGTKVALIQTITQDQAVSTQGWTQSLRALSDELGRPIVEIAGAGYDALSNQVTQGKNDTEEFLRTATNFSRTVGATPAEGVNILSTAVKGFNIDVANSEKAAATFFNAIDYGRLTAKGFEQTLGRISPLTKNLKISLEEVGAAEAALTQVGFNAEEAGTRFSNLLLGFEKPSDSLKKFFASFGAQGGKQFIAVAGSFGEAMKLIAKGAAEGVVNIEELFPELRKMQAAFGLTNDSLNAYDEALNLITKGTERFKKAQSITQETFAKKYADEWNKVANLITVDLAQGFQKTFVQINELLGGFSNWLRVIGGLLKDTILIGGSFVGTFVITKGIIIGITSVATAIAKVTAEIKAAQTLGGLGTLYTTASGPSAAVLVGSVAAGYIATKLVFEKIKEAYQAMLDEIANKKAIEIKVDVKKFKEALANISESVVKYADGTVAAFSTAAGRIIYILSQETNKFKEYLKDVKAESESAFKGVVTILERGIHSIESAATKARETVNNTGKEIKKIQDEQAKDRFDTEIAIIRKRNEGGSPLSQEEVNLTRQRVAILKEAALAQPKTPKGIEESNKLLEEARQVLNGLRQGFIDNNAEAGKLSNTLADGVQNINKMSDATHGLFTDYSKVKPSIFSDFIDTDINKVNQMSNTIKGLPKAYGDARAAQREVNELDKIRTQLLEDQSKALAKIAVEEEDNANKAKVDLANLQEAYKKFNDFSFNDPKTGKIRQAESIDGKPPNQSKFLEGEIAKYRKLGEEVDRLSTELSGKLGKNPFAGVDLSLGIREAAEKRITELKKAMEKQGNEVIKEGAVTEQIDLVEKAQARVTDEVNKTRDSYEKILATLVKVKEELGGSAQKIANISSGINKSGLLGEKGEILDQNASRINKNPTEANNILDNILPKLIQEAKTPVPPSLLARALSAGSIAPPSKIPGDQNITLANGNILKLNDALATLKTELESVSQSSNKLDALQVVSGNLKTLLEGITVSGKNIPTQLFQSGEAFEKLAESMRGNVPAITDAANDLVKAFNNISSKLQSVTPPITQDKATGGVVNYYSNGFIPKGTDTIPAMLSPNEFVMPAKPTRMFLNELELMRKGINPFKARPNYYAEGKSFLPQIYTNTMPRLKNNPIPQNNTNFGDIHVNVNNGNSPNLGQQIGQQIRRELRRSTLKF